MPTQHTSSNQGTTTQEKPTQENASQQKKSTVTEAKEVAQELRHDLEEQVTRGRQRAMEQGQEFVQHQKEKAAEEVHIFGSAIRAAAETLQEENHGHIAGYIEAAADELESVSTYLRERRFEELYHDANRFARRHPEIFLGGMFLAGIAITRFLKASEPEPEPMEYSGSMESGSMYYADDYMDEGLEGDDLSYVGGAPAFGSGIPPATPTTPTPGQAPTPTGYDLPGSGIPQPETDLSHQGTTPPGMDDPTTPEVPRSTPSNESKPSDEKKFDL